MTAPRRIGDYEILNELGRGGMGRVFRVRNVLSDRIEAMKVLLPDLADREDLAARFLREIKVLAALSHPNIAALRTALTAENQLVMIMEYVEGESLAARLQHGPVPVPEALGYFDQALDALAYAHTQGVVHRDIKPANMMLTPQGVVKVTDFGIARAAGDQTLTVAGSTTGSLSYMPPEQVSGEPTDARSDIYSAGISLYEMVTGRTPFEANSGFGVMLAHLNEQPRPPIEVQPNLPGGLNEVILKAIAKNPADRFQSADEFRGALGAFSPTIAASAALPTATVFPTEGAVPPNATTRAAAAEMPPRVTPRTAGARAIPAGEALPVPVVPLKKGLHPGVFMALGALLVIAAVVATGVYLRQAEAGGSTAASLTPAPEAAQDAAPVPSASASVSGGDPAPPGDAAGTEAAAAPSGDPGPRAASDPGTPSAPPVRPSGIATGRTAAREAEPARAPSAQRAAPDHEAPRLETAKPAAPPAAVPQDTAALDELEEEIDQLSVRAAAVNSSLDRLEQAQARQGLGLRGDIVARRESMNLNLVRAQDALGTRDAARARKYREQADRDLQALEKFLGR